jgi:hypothetical protein
MSLRHCEDCGCEYDDDEEGTEEYCSACYSENHTYLCCFCEESEDNLDAEHKFLVVFDADVPTIGNELTPGIYRITRFPYFADGMIEAHLYSSSLERVADLPEGHTENWQMYPCGHLCVACQVIAGCESGRNSRPAREEWFADVCRDCELAGVPFYLKQIEQDGKIIERPAIDGRRWEEWPEAQHEYA